MTPAVIEGVPVTLPAKYEKYPQNVKVAISEWVTRLKDACGDSLVTVRVDRVLYQNSQRPMPSGSFSTRPAPEEES